MTTTAGRSAQQRLRSLPCGPSVPTTSLAATGLAAAILDATDSIVIVTDVHSGLVVGLNSAAEGVLGLAPDAAAGRTLREICGPGEGDLVAWSSRFLTDATGQRTHIVMTGVDVTAECSRCSAAEAETADRLRALERIKAELVDTVSHELRTPLTSILGYVELLKDDVAGDLNPRQRQLANAVDRNGHRLLALIDDLLTVATTGSGKVHLESAPSHPRGVVSAGGRRVLPDLPMGTSRHE